MFTTLTLRLHALSGFRLFCLIVCLPLVVNGQQKKEYKNLGEAFKSAGKLRGEYRYRNVRWIDGGDRFSYSGRAPETNRRAIRICNPATGRDTTIFRMSEHKFPQSGSSFNYLSYRWTDDSRHLVFQSSNRSGNGVTGRYNYYLYSIKSKSLTLLVKNVPEAKMSPDATKIAYERHGDLFVYDVEKDKEIRLTGSGTKHVYNGKPSWAYREEFGVWQGWRWAPGSQYIAYWQTDEQGVPTYRMTNYKGHHPEYKTSPYPQAGDTNAVVRIGVANIETGHTEWMNLPDGGYIPQIYWTSRPGTLAIVHLNRLQNHVKLFFSDAKTGKSRLVMQETSPKWIDLNNFYGTSPRFYFPENQKEFYWVSDRDGWSHIYRYNYRGDLVNQVTKGKWEVTHIYTANYNRRRLYYASTEVSPLERHLYGINLDGTGKKKLTRYRGRHHISMGANGSYYLNRYSNTSTPIRIELMSSQKGRIKTLLDNKPVWQFLQSYAYAPRRLFNFMTSDGQSLDGYIIKPMHFDSTKSYPLVMNVYGGPGAQGVFDTFEASAWEQYMAQEGFVVANVNNRGSDGYGRKFKKIVYEHLGKWEAHDFVETANYLASKPWIDSTRMGIRGHSYGGYMAAYTMLKYPGTFRAAVAGAPVTDWQLYDSIYSERYMGLPKDNPEGYKKSAVMTYAPQKQGHLLILHSAMDNNVHVQNTMQLLTALIDAGKDYNLRMYPPGSHGVAYNLESHHLMYQTITDYLTKYLKPND